MTKIKTTLPGIAVLALACASNPSTELRTAREAYEQARSGPAATVNPKGIYEAEQALQAAEEAHEEEAGSVKEKHRAYLAMRRAQLAVATGNEKLSEKSLTDANERYRSVLETEARQLSEAKRSYAQELSQTQEELNEVRSELSETDATLSQSREKLEAKEKELEQRVSELQKERQQRKLAEARAKQARAHLEELAQVREDSKNLVITLSGSLLFETGSDKLMNLAKDRLETVADALEGYGDNTVVIEGHTDSRGTEAFNRDLSRRRAEAVMEHLVEEGVPAKRISVVGRGESDPIASNDTPEGRANNRRVEIILDKQEQSRAGERSSKAEPQQVQQQNNQTQDMQQGQDQDAQQDQQAQKKDGEQEQAEDEQRVSQRADEEQP